MAPYDDWNKGEDEEEDEIQEYVLETRRDVILFCIDCSPSMQELFEDPEYEDVNSCNLFSALDAAMQISKKKITIGPNDSVGVLLFNTTRRPDPDGPRQGAEIHKNLYLYQAVQPVGASPIQKLARLLDSFRQADQELRNEFPPLEGSRVPMGDVFTSCNWVLREGAPKTATKRVFLITDEDDPHPGNLQLFTSSKTTYTDLTQSGVLVEPFFISTADKPFDPAKFYRGILSRQGEEEDDEKLEDGPLSHNMSITRVEDMLEQMRFLELPKRALFTLPLELAKGLTIGVKGFSLVTEQKRGAYKYFAITDDKYEVAEPSTVYVDEEREESVLKSQILYGTDIGTSVDEALSDDEDEAVQEYGTRVVRRGQRPYYTAEEIASFRTLGREPGIKLLGFKDMDQLRFEDNIKHSHFIYPDEMSYSGSRRTFLALIRTMVKKNKFALALGLPRRNSTPVFCALVPQIEKIDEEESDSWGEPSGLHMITLPFADDIREAGVLKGYIPDDDDLVKAAQKWVHKLTIKSKEGYPVDSLPNPALSFHNAILQARAFEEDFDPESFENVTDPNYDRIHKKAGNDMMEWKMQLMEDPAAVLVPEPTKKTGSKRKAPAMVDADDTEIRVRYEAGTLNKLTVDVLKNFLRSKSLPLGGNKAELVKRVQEYLEERGKGA